GARVGRRPEGRGSRPGGRARRHQAPASALHDHRSDLYRTAPWPRLCHRQGLVQVGGLDLRVPADELLSLDEGAVLHYRTATLEGDSRRSLGSLQLVPIAQPPVVLSEPPADPDILLTELVGSQCVECRLVARRATEQKHVLHLFASWPYDKRRPRPFDNTDDGIRRPSEIARVLKVHGRLVDSPAAWP